MTNLKRFFQWLLYVPAVVGVILIQINCSGEPSAPEATASKAPVAAPEPAPAPRKPNLIFVLADDLGYGDVSSFGQMHFETPHIDAMAKNGLRFSDFYAGSAVCAPSRSVLMTGQHQGRTRIRANLMNVVVDGEAGFISPSLIAEDITVAEVLKTVGYRTGIVGKWGLGEIDNEGHPNEQGFDYFYGYLNHIHAHNHFPEFLWRNREKVSLPNVVQDVGCTYCYKFGFEGNVSTKREVYADDLIRDESLAFIERNKDQPFFLFVSLISPHANNEAERVEWAHGLEVPSYGEFIDKSWPNPQKGLAAMIRHIDNTVGSIMSKLETLNIADNTIVIFSSDNGPHAEGGNNPDFFNSNGPLRGIKRDLYEGGIRVPTLAWGPGLVPAGENTDHAAYFGDVMATFAELAGAEIPDNTDSLSFAPVLLGNNEAQKASDFLYWEFYSHGSAQAVRMGKWKGVRTPMRTGTIELYDLESDPYESNDLALQHPELIAKMQAVMETNHQPSPEWLPQFEGKSPDRLRQEKK